jgi:hypothetical protein
LPGLHRAAAAFAPPWGGLYDSEQIERARLATLAALPVEAAGDAGMGGRRNTGKHMRKAIVMLWALLGFMTSASAQVSIGIGLPNVSIGINLPVYPDLVPVPNHPVYYAPRLDANYFFYDGLYWVYQDDDWYASSWYNGPWGRVAPDAVPLFVLRVPVRYYRLPPAYFRGWRSDAPPRWGEHWGGEWQQRRPGWDRWDRHAVPRPAPLPVYQRRYTGERYPSLVERQQALRSQNYRFEPRESVVRQHLQQQRQQHEQNGIAQGPRHDSPRHEAAAPPRQRDDRGPRDKDRGRGDKGYNKNDKGDDRGRGRDR